MTPKKINFSDLISTRVPLLELEMGMGGETSIYQLYPPNQMNTEGYTRYVAASRIIAKTIRQTDKAARNLITNIEKRIAGEEEPIKNKEQFSLALKELLIRPDFEDLPDDDDADVDDDDDEPEKVELSDKKKFVNLISWYVSGFLLNDILEMYEEYAFDVQGLLTSSEYIAYLNEAIESAFNMPKGVTGNWGLSQLQEMQKAITEAINKQAKEEKKKEKAKKALNQIKALDAAKAELNKDEAKAK